LICRAAGGIVALAALMTLPALASEADRIALADCAGLFEALDALSTQEASMPGMADEIRSVLSALPPLGDPEAAIAAAHARWAAAMAGEAPPDIGAAEQACIGAYSAGLAAALARIRAGNAPAPAPRQRLIEADRPGTPRQPAPSPELDLRIGDPSRPVEPLPRLAPAR